ncbi:MAG TPA: hypothetical protein VNW99_07610 [Cytophagaceae bacterium]|jgi:hypothetical protein|nr:hypothetical protein [Cytophagaceae bacterium]
MKVLIYIELLDEPSVNYNKEIISWVKENIKDLVSFDLDNFSDQYMFKYATELIEKEERIVVVVEVKGEASAGKVMGLAEKIIKHKDKCLVMMNGENAMLGKMFGLLKGKFKHEASLEECKKTTSDFLNN